MADRPPTGQRPHWTLLLVLPVILLAVKLGASMPPAAARGSLFLVFGFFLLGSRVPGWLALGVVLPASVLIVLHELGVPGEDLTLAYAVAGLTWVTVSLSALYRVQFVGPLEPFFSTAEDADRIAEAEHVHALERTFE